MRITYTDGNVTVSGEDGRTWAVQIPRAALTGCTIDKLDALSAQLQAITNQIRDTRENLRPRG